MTDGTMSSTGEREGNTGLWEIAVGEGEMMAQWRTMSSTGEREGNTACKLRVVFHRTAEFCSVLNSSLLLL